MAWTERQHAMLREMGIVLWNAPAMPLGEQPPSTLDADVAALPPPAARAAAVVAVAPPLAEPLRSRPSGVATMDWPALREAVADCRACKLCEGRRQTVFGVGHTRAHWMIVGEAPGEQEDLQGEPFVGAAGQLLDRMLWALGLTRAEADPARQVFIANTLKCRPPRNRNPEPGEIAQCAPFLQRQIALVRPRVLLALGAVAAKALLGVDEPLGRLRGRVHDRAGTPVVVTYHPAYLLRQPSEKAKAWDDLCLAADTVG
jgi:DNA polymerase